jgi:transglutaminase-like putative cysteine protease
MLIRIGYDLAFSLDVPAPMTLMLAVRPERRSTFAKPDDLLVEPYVPVTFFKDTFGNSCGRVLAPAGTVRFTADAIVTDCGLPDPVAPHAMQHAVQDLPPECLQFLLPSRYCEVDKLQDIAWELFKGAPLGWGRVQAICDFVHGHIQFGYQYARPTRTAVEGFNERQGVCRDFTHLAVTFCRCMNIPARYATGYLGDIGIPPVPCPMDFSAWFEVYLGGQWWTFDARHNKPRIGRVMMAFGRDAADVALTTSFGVTKLEKFVVWTDEMRGD